MSNSLVYPWLLAKLIKPEIIRCEHCRHVTISVVTMGIDINMLKKCIGSVLKSTPIDFPMSEIYIWHNGNENVDEIKHLCITDFNEHPSFDIAYMPSFDGNIGFGPAHNKVAELANGRYFIILNDDVEFNHYDWIRMLISELSDEVLQVGAQNPSTNNRLSGNGGGYLSDGIVVEYVEGTVLAMETDVACAYGPFDSLFEFAYQEDSDLSLRIQSWGYGIKYVQIDFTHYRATTSSKVKVDVRGHQVLNKIKFGNRWSWYLNRRDFSPRIAVVRAAAMGDVLMVTSTIRRIRTLAPYATIDVFTFCVEMLDNNPDVDNVYQHKLLQEYAPRYHAIIKLDAAYENNPQVLTYEAFYEAAVIKDHPLEWPVLVFSDKEKAVATDIIAQHKTMCGAGPIAAFHTGKTAWAGRNFECDKFKDVALYLQNIGWTIIEVGSKDTEPMGIDSTSVYEQPPRISAAVISMCQMFIGIDSFPWNVAQICKVPSVVVFGCIDPKTRVLDYNIVKPIVAEGMTCLGCHHAFRGPIARSSCTREPQSAIAPCMKEIAPIQIIDAARVFVEGIGG